MTGLALGRAPPTSAASAPSTRTASSRRAPLFAVADGMGGHAGRRGGQPRGRWRRSMAASRPDGDATRRPRSRRSWPACASANRAVFERSLSEPELRGMGTTSPRSPWSSERRRRAPVHRQRGRHPRLRRAGRPSSLQITRDHILRRGPRRGGRDHRRGGPHPPAAQHRHPGPRRRARRRGRRWEVVPYAGDRYLLCSDGLFNEVDDDEIARRADRRAPTPRRRPTSWSGWPTKRGGHDNISVVVVDVTADDVMTARDRAHATCRPSTPTLPAAGRRHRSAPAPACRRPDGRPDDHRPTSDRPLRPPAAASEHARRQKRGEARADAAGVGGCAVGCCRAPARGRRHGLGAIVYYGRSGYYVGFAGDNVAIYKGRPGGLSGSTPPSRPRIPLTRASVLPDQPGRPDRAGNELRRTRARPRPTSRTSPNRPTATHHRARPPPPCRRHHHDHRRRYGPPCRPRARSSTTTAPAHRDHDEPPAAQHAVIASSAATPSSA